MTDPNAIIHGIAVNAKTITGLHVSEVHSGAISAPHLIVSIGGIEYATTFQDESDDVTFRALLLTSMSSSVGETNLLDYMKPVGDLSIKQAIESDGTLGGIVDYTEVLRARAPGITTYNKVQYYAVDFDIIVGVSN